MSSSSANPSIDETRGSAGIARVLRGQIRRGLLTANEQFPAISELARRFATTPITVRRALRALEEDGLVRVEHGVGTFVADWARRDDFLHLPSFSVEMAERRLESATAVRGRETGVRNAVAAEALGLPAEAPLVTLARLRVVEGVPIAFQRSYLPEALAGVAREYSSERSLYELLRERTGRVPVSAEERLRAVAVPVEVAAELQVAAAAPGWLALRVTRDPEGDPLLFDEAYFAGDRVELRVRRGAGQTALEYGVVLPEGSATQGGSG